MKEFRLKSGSKILNYIRQFSATEKVIFGAISITFIVSALYMANESSAYFKLEIPAYGGILTEGLVGLPRTINPVIAVSDIDRDISSLVYSGLMKYDGSNIVPDLAKSYNISSDGLKYNFILNEESKFHDGKKVTADDVIFTIEKIQDSTLKSPRHADWTNITATKISEKEIEFALKQPYSPFLSNTTIGIIPKHIWGNVSNDQFIFSEYNIKPIGSGPYKMSGISRDKGGIPTSYTLKSWDSNDKPYIDTIIFKFFPDTEMVLNALDSGEIDSTPSISPTVATKLNDNSAQAYKITSASLPRIFGVFLNQNQNPILADKNVRKALDLSIDKDAIIKIILNGYGVSIDGPLPPDFKKTINTKDVQNISPDIDLAASLLKKSGWIKGVDGIYNKKSGKNASTTLSLELFTADTIDLKQTADMIKKSWANLGVSVNIKVFDQNDLYQNVIKPRKYDALLFGELIGKDRDLYAFWHSSQRNAPGLNIAGYTNSTVDTLLNKIRNTNDRSVLDTTYKQLNETIRGDIPAIFLYAPDFIYAIPKKLGGINLEDMTNATDRFNSIRNWYLETDNVWKVFAKNKK